MPAMPSGEGRTEELLESIRRTLLEEARRNELRIAYVRVIALALVTALDWYQYFHPASLGRTELPVSISAVAGNFFLASTALLVALRRGWYRPWLRFAAPAIDGVFILLAFWNVLRILGPEEFVRLGSLPNCGIACAFVAASGALRLDRRAVALATALAVLDYSALALASVPLSPQVGIGISLLLGVGLLSLRMTSVVHRAVRSEVGRATLGRFLPKVVVASAYADPVALLSRPRTAIATILISDLRGFTAMAEKLEPAVVLDLLNDLQGAFAAAVRDAGGIVDKFMGDGMLAVFGAPEPLEGHAAAALAAARRMTDALREINAEWASLARTPVKVGIGIHSGPVVTGCLGSGAHFEFTVIGDTVNTASRLEALTKEKGVPILVSEETARLAGAALEPVGEVTVRGRAAPLRVCTVADRAAS